MNDACKQIEPLLYLFREDELSANERALVAAHCLTCASCRQILDHLALLDASSAPLRAEVPRASGEASVIDETLEQIAGTPKRRVTQLSSPAMEEFIGWLRPALGTLLIFSAMVLTYELSRDALRLHRLETRLASENTAPGLSGEPEQTGIGAVLELAGVLQVSPSPFSARRQTLPPSAESFGPAVQNAIQERSSLIDKFAREYPRLFAINAQDGINDEERLILASDGRNFLREFELYLQTGAGQ